MEQPNKLKNVTLTMQEIWDAMKKNVHRNKKKYYKKIKHKNKRHG